jgi:putative tryptophan/tyrosine transport system substrate-binding protein
MRRAADETARDNLDAVIVASNELAHAIQQVTTTVPIVFFAVTDPDEDGLVVSLAKPGGNVTGFSHMTGDLAAKRLQLLKDMLPKARKIGVLATQRHGPTDRECARFGLDAVWFTAPTAGEIGAAFAAMKRARPDGLLVLPHPMFWLERRRIVAQASEVGIPAIYENKDFVMAGGLMAYGASLVDMSRRAAGYVDKILKGARPGDLPVQQPTEFELVINRKTAKALGLTIPQSLLLRADQVIE